MANRHATKSVGTVNPVGTTSVGTVGSNKVGTNPVGTIGTNTVGTGAVVTSPAGGVDTSAVGDGAVGTNPAGSADTGAGGGDTVGTGTGVSSPVAPVTVDASAVVPGAVGAQVVPSTTVPAATTPAASPVTVTAQVVPSTTVPAATTPAASPVTVTAQVVPSTTVPAATTPAASPVTVTAQVVPSTTVPAATTPAAAPVTPPAAVATSSGLREGAYVGAANPSGLSAFDAATGTHASIATDYLPATSGFAGMDGANGDLNWLLGAWAGTGATLSLGVPMIPSDASGNPVGTLAEGASGAYNASYVTLAETLVAAGESNAYLRLGWEFDGSWVPWYAGIPAAEASFAEYFRQIVTAMRSVPGANFKFIWNPEADAFTASGYNVTLAYPGNSYVDIIGLDAYDQVWITAPTPSNAWNEVILPELNAAHQFAVAQGKPLAITEWGSIIRSDGKGLGDDPLYVNNFIAWMKSVGNNVTFETYFDFVDPSGLNSQLTGGDFPNSLAAFKADLG